MASNPAEEIFGSYLYYYSIFILIWETFFLFPIIILFAVGESKNWDINIGAILIADIWIKVTSIVTRITGMMIFRKCSIFGFYVMLVQFIASFILQITLYIVALSYCFKDNDCKDKAEVTWIGLLILSIEGLIVFLLILILLLLILSFFIWLCFYRLSQRKKERREKGEKEIELKNGQLE